MAKAIINLQKESGGIVKISPVDGLGVTEVTVPESGELVTKEYADLKVALIEFIGTNQNIATNGYQKLPGGIIIQWGNVKLSTSSAKNWESAVITFPIAFNSTGLRIFTSIGIPTSNQLIIPSGEVLSTTQAAMYLNSESPISNQQINYIAVGK